jgi:methyl-accepting chemotaxis protein
MGPKGPTGAQGPKGWAGTFPKEDEMKIRALLQRVQHSVDKAAASDRVEHAILTERLRMVKDHFARMQGEMFKIEEVNEVAKAHQEKTVKDANEAAKTAGSTREMLELVEDNSRRIETEQSALREKLIQQTR